MMNSPNRQIIRTGNLAHDQQLLREAQAGAAARGLTAQVQMLPQGGFQVDYVPIGAMPAPMTGWAPPQMMGPQACQACGRAAPTKFVTFHQNIGALIIRFPKTIRGHLCRRCMGKYFSEYTLISLFFGWWGVISFFYTLVTIPANIITWFGARDLPDEFR
jgi:hypothetical protein